MFKSLKLVLLSIGSVLLVIYLLLVSYLYVNQESFIFQPETLSADYKFTFEGKFEELSIPVEKDVNLNGVLFKADKGKGLIFKIYYE